MVTDTGRLSNYWFGRMSTREDPRELSFFHLVGLINSQISCALGWMIRLGHS